MKEVAMHKHSIVLIAVTAAVAAATVFAAAEASARSKASRGEIVVCKAKTTSEPVLPAQPNGKTAGGCAAFGTVNDAGTEVSQFTLVGNPPKGVHGRQTFTGKQGTLTIQFAGGTAPVAFKPGPKPTVLGAVAIANSMVVSATGAYAAWKGKKGVNAAYENDATTPPTAQLSIILP
jgi:hypothetical protein